MSNIIRGQQLMLFVWNETSNEYKTIAYATNHTFTVTGNTTEVSSKDHGVFTANEIGSISWEVSTENLYSDDGYDALYDLMMDRTPIKVAFSKIKDVANAETGLTTTGGLVPKWEVSNDTVYRTGNAVISSLDINAPNGENATFSCTLTGSGPLTKVTPA